MTKLGVEGGVALGNLSEEGLEVAGREVDTSHMGCIRLQTSSYIITSGEYMHRPIDIFVKGGEIDDKTKFSTLFGYKPSMSTKTLSVHLVSFSLSPLAIPNHPSNP